MAECYLYLSSVWSHCQHCYTCCSVHALGRGCCSFHTSVARARKVLLGAVYSFSIAFLAAHVQLHAVSNIK